MYVLPDTIMGSILTAILAELGTASTGVVLLHLYTNLLTPNKNSILTDFTELTAGEVPGYTPASANWFAGTPHRLNNGAWEGPDNTADPNFICTTSAPPTPQVVYGWFATDSTNAILLGAGLFGTPYTFTSIGDGFTLPGNPTLAQVLPGTLSCVLPDLEPN